MRYVVILSLAICIAEGLATAPAEAQPLPFAEALSDEFPDTLFVVREPVETRRTINFERSGGLVPAEDMCLDRNFVSRTGRIWFTFNNRGPEAGRRDALSLMIAKWRDVTESRPASQRVSFAAFRNSNPWYRGRVQARFQPEERPLRNVTLAEWNDGHQSGNTARYDRLFGRRPGDRFHASPRPDGTSSSTDSAWWALPELETTSFSELVVDARLLRFSRAGYDQPTANGVSFYLSPGSFDHLLLKTRSDAQSLEGQFRFDLGDCSPDEGPGDV